MTRWLAPVMGLMILVACSEPRVSAELIRVTVPPGASVRTITDSLTARGIVDSPRWFKLYVKLVGRESTIQAGVYDFARASSVPRVVGTLVRGRTAQNRLVLPEGLMLREIAASVEEQLNVPSEDLMAAARDSELLRQVGARGPTLEGYLYPNTYQVPVGASARAIVRQMVAEFEARWLPQWNARLDTLGMTRDEVVTLASIVEAEVHAHVDRYYVSSVYHNRLARGMRLEADPTVIYALGRRRRLFTRDYRVESPYNTYLIDGLPPHAIGQPSAASIEATLYPRESDFLFFVAGPDGKHIFTRTYRQHLAAIREIRGTPQSSR